MSCGSLSRASSYKIEPGFWILRDKSDFCVCLFVWTDTKVVTAFNSVSLCLFHGSFQTSSSTDWVYMMSPKRNKASYTMKQIHQFTDIWLFWFLTLMYFPKIFHCMVNYILDQNDFEFKDCKLIVIQTLLTVSLMIKNCIKKKVKNHLGLRLLVKLCTMTIWKLTKITDKCWSLSPSVQSVKS